jgi:ArsR family transcriptional regulator
MNKSPSDADDDDKAVARKLAALAHPVRLRLLRHMGATDSCCVKEMVAQVGLAQSTVSQHLKVLVEAGLVRYRPERQRSCYCVDAGALDELICAVDHTLARCCGERRRTGLGDSPDNITRRVDAIASPAVDKDI